MRREMAGLAPHLFFAETFGADRADRADKPHQASCPECPALSVLDLFSQGFHRITVGFTASAQIHL
jgi:hypothetical protein